MSYQFSARTGWDVGESAFAAAIREARAAGRELVDLTVSNPTVCGFCYNVEGILEPLRDVRAMTYDPDPRGMRSAREAVGRYYADHGAALDPDAVMLTTSTSEAYSYLFRLLCDPGDEVLIGQPGYPLFDFLARLDNVRLVPYELFYDHGWHLDLEALRRRITPRTRAVTVVHPNNPTGHFTRHQERAAIEGVCREHALALIVDEVFLDYGLTGKQESKDQESFATGPHPVPTFVLSGLSKVAALPQMKAAWIACFAEKEAVQRLEIVADTFLSLSAPIQCALSSWLSGRAGLQQQIRQRLQGNIAALDDMLRRQTLVTRLKIEAGWYALLRVPALQTEEQTAVDLLVGRGVIVHPGGFFGLPGEGWIVVSLLGPEKQVRGGIEALLQHFKGHL